MPDELCRLAADEIDRLQHELDKHSPASSVVGINPDRLTIYGGIYRIAPRGKLQLRRAISACRTPAEFYRAIRVAKASIEETTDADEIRLAMSEPGTVFVRSMLGNYLRNPWIKY